MGYEGEELRGFLDFNPPLTVLTFSCRAQYAFQTLLYLHLNLPNLETSDTSTKVGEALTLVFFVDKL